jgi:hypothetical protein
MPPINDVFSCGGEKTILTNKPCDSQKVVLRPSRTVSGRGPDDDVTFVPLPSSMSIKRSTSPTTPFHRVLAPRSRIIFPEGSMRAIVPVKQVQIRQLQKNYYFFFFGCTLK